ncbi:MAG: ATP-dependent DNA helicase RecG [Ardenticatenales bacterium]|nr:ATP-dependent DNA helicase RecG [Ardenticatenales bacterium]
MHPAVLQLTRILALEAAQGCRDHAVIGGLEAYVDHWRAVAAAALPAATLATVVGSLEGYARLSPADRAERIARVQAEIGEAPEAVSTAPRSPAPHSPSPRSPAPPSTAAAARRPSFTHHPLDDPRLDDPVTALAGVGPKLARDLARLELRTVRDVLFHAPLRHQDFSVRVPIARVRPGDEVTVAGRVVEVRRAPGKAVREILTVVIADDSGRIGLTFFNQPYLAKTMAVGRAIVASGQATAVGGRVGLASPEWEPTAGAGTHTGRLVPVYPLVAGLGQRTLRRVIADAADAFAPCVGDALPDDVRVAEGLMGRAEAVWTLHRATDRADYARARARLAFDELLTLQLWARRRRLERAQLPGVDLSGGRALQQRFVTALSFRLTGAQARCVAEITGDLCRPTPMSRLLQGDVGSGKTAVAGAAVALCAGAGLQAAVMAPTEILADQHHRGLGRLLEAIGFAPFDPTTGATSSGVAVKCYARLVGGMKPAEKAAVAAGLADGSIDVVFGTHALIQTTVRFARLGLSVIDEQHRFGVLQRSTLAAAPGGPAPHVLIMTATPIPRTLAHVLNADLEQSVIDTLPPGRQPIRTLWLKPDERAKAYGFLRQRVERGEQAFVVCPLVEESETIDSPAATTLFERLQGGVFHDVSLGLLHGRMRPAEKDAVMRAFHAGEIRILVATTVIEVGIDVPNATVMLIDGADRFGLAQLHQLRGRVGRGQAESFCLLLAADPSRGAAERLQAVAATSDGLALAERDLQLRGPGDYFGTQQAGIVDRFRFARLVGDPAPLVEAARVAGAIIARDPALGETAHAALSKAVAAFSAGADRA